MIDEKPFNIDDQIKSIEQEVAKYSELLFEAKGMLRLAYYLKKKCRIEPLTKETDASSGTARQ